MKKFLLICFVLGVTNISSIGAVCFGVEQRESILPEITPPPMNSCEKQEKLEIKNTVNHYDNVPIFNQNGNRKVNIILKQPSAKLGTQQ